MDVDTKQQLLEKLNIAVTEFLALLDIEEESDSGRVFRPTYISSCRVLTTEKLGRILSDMRYITKTLEES